MKSTRIVRKLDPMGRIVLPMYLREKIGIDENTFLEIFIEGEYIYLKKYQPACIFCGETQDIETFKDKLVCKTCISKIRFL